MRRSGAATREDTQAATCSWGCARQVRVSMYRAVHSASSEVVRRGRYLAADL